MATKATASEYAALAKDRWDTLTIGVQEPAAEETNSDLMTAWMASTREILGRMVHGVAPDEYQALCAAEERLNEALKNEAIALCEAVEEQRHAGAPGRA
jgi:hypothetical protein